MAAASVSVRSPAVFWMSHVFGDDRTYPSHTGVCLCVQIPVWWCPYASTATQGVANAHASNSYAGICAVCVCRCLYGGASRGPQGRARTELMRWHVCCMCVCRCLYGGASRGPQGRDLSTAPPGAANTRTYQTQLLECVPNVCRMRAVCVCAGACMVVRLVALICGNCKSVVAHTRTHHSQMLACVPYVCCMCVCRCLYGGASRGSQKRASKLMCRHVCCMCMCLCRCLYGGASRGPQGRDLSRSPQLVIATPGRLLDFVSSGELSLNRVSYQCWGCNSWRCCCMWLMLLLNLDTFGECPNRVSYESDAWRRL
jgi:hypothetical protein